MNNVIQTLLSHRSIRSYTQQPLSEEQIEAIVQSAQAASTSSFMQPYTIIGVKDKELKEKLALLSKNRHVADCAHFFVFCMDLHRHKLAAQIEGLDAGEVEPVLESTEWFMIGLIDTAIAAQNAVIAAESMGLGVCYIGGLRNNLEDITQLLQTPDRVIPLFGLCVGYPADDPGLKPRLPLEHVYHEDGYRQDDPLRQQQLETYNRQISAYYRERTDGQRSDRWSEQVVAKLRRAERMYMKEFLKKKGLPLR